jgi:hypothetical protein
MNYGGCNNKFNIYDYIKKAHNAQLLLVLFIGNY